MGYEWVRVTEELSASVRRETLGELVRGIATEGCAPRVEGLVSKVPTRHEVRVDGDLAHTHCFVDALMLPFLLGGRTVEVGSESPSGEEVRAVVSAEGVESRPGCSLGRPCRSWWTRG